MMINWVNEDYENFLNSEEASYDETYTRRAKRHYKQVVDFTKLSKKDLKKAYRFVRRLEAYSDYYAEIGLDNLSDFYAVAYEYTKKEIQKRENWPESEQNKFITNGSRKPIDL